MKRITLIILLLLPLSFLSASFSPSVTIMSGVNTLWHEKNRYYSMENGIEIGILSYKIKSITLTLPIDVSHVTKSTENASLFSPQYTKASLGFEAALDNRRIGGSIAFFYGYEDFIEEKALMKYMEGRVAFHVILTKYLTLFIPVSYIYTPQGNEMSFRLALRIGGEK